MLDFKEQLKALKHRHRERIAALRGRLKVQTKDLSAIKAALEEGRAEGKTVPQIASDVGLPADKVLWYVTALRKYGQAAESDKDGSYFRYVPATNRGAFDADGNE